jgi:hypothetical protein
MIKKVSRLFLVDEPAEVKFRALEFKFGCPEIGF